MEEDSKIAAKEEKDKSSKTPKAKEATDDEAKKQDDGAEDTPKSGKKIGPLILTVAALVSFVVFLAVFSYTMGVFDPPPPPEGDPGATAQTDASLPGEENLEQDGYYSEFGKAAAEVEAAQESELVDTVAELSLLEKRQRDLQVQEESINLKKRELEDLKIQIEELLVRKEGIANERVTYVAKLIDGMKQEEMAGLISNLDNNTILTVLPNMKPQTASRVLALLPPKRAANITTAILATEDK